MMGELITENKTLVLRIYVVVVFLAPWMLAMIWQVRYMNGIREKMGTQFWFAIFPNQEARDLVNESAQLSRLECRRNFWFFSALGMWVVGGVVFVLLLGWLNGKF